MLLLGCLHGIYLRAICRSLHPASIQRQISYDHKSDTLTCPNAYWFMFLNYRDRLEQKRCKAAECSAHPLCSRCISGDAKYGMDDMTIIPVRYAKKLHLPLLQLADEQEKKVKIKRLETLVSSLITWWR